MSLSEVVHNGAASPIITDLPVHPGTFFEQTPDTLRRAAQADYSAIGAAAVLLNSAGEVLIIDHKQNKKLADHTLGVSSETVGGFRRDGLVYAETIIQSLGRCLRQEIELDTDSIGLTSAVEGSYYQLTDWPRGTNPDDGKVLGINIALWMDDETANKAEGVKSESNEEVYRAFFVDLEDILDGRLLPIRPGTIGCLRALKAAGLLEPANLDRARLVFPKAITPEFDIDLRNL